MKFCNNCSAPLDDNAVYCPECGASMADDFSSNDTQQTYSNERRDEQNHTIPQGSSDTSYSYNSENNYSNSNYNAPKESNPGVPWLIVSIVSFFCCCNFIFSIPGFVMALLSMTSFNEGDVELAKSRAKTAMILTIVGFIVNLVLYAAMSNTISGLIETIY